MSLSDGTGPVVFSRIENACGLYGRDNRADEALFAPVLCDAGLLTESPLYDSALPPTAQHHPAR